MWLFLSELYMLPCSLRDIGGGAVLTPKTPRWLRFCLPYSPSPPNQEIRERHRSLSLPDQQRRARSYVRKSPVVRRL